MVPLCMASSARRDARRWCTHRRDALQPVGLPHSLGSSHHHRGRTRREGCRLWSTAGSGRSAGDWKRGDVVKIGEVHRPYGDEPARRIVRKRLITGLVEPDPMSTSRHHWTSPSSSKECGGAVCGGAVRPAGPGRAWAQRRRRDDGRWSLVRRAAGGTCGAGSGRAVNATTYGCIVAGLAIGVSSGS